MSVPTVLTPQLVPAEELGDANALLGIAASASAVAGPALAGVLVAVAGPAVVIAVDAASYGASVLALASVRVPALLAVPQSPPRQRPASRVGRRRGAFRADVASGWAQFRSRPWLVATSVQFALSNLFAWGPFLVLGPLLARDYLGGAGAWGAVMACYGSGSVAGGLLIMRRRPRRPVVAATAASFGYALPCAALAVRAPLAWLAAAALLAGAGSATGQAFELTALQQHVPQEALARVSALQMQIAFAFGPLAFAAAGPVAAVLGAGPVLGFGAAWVVAGSAAVLALPSVRAVTSTPGPARLVT